MKILIYLISTCTMCLLLITGCGKKEEAPKKASALGSGSHIEWDSSTLKKVSGGSAERYLKPVEMWFA
jgi:uncharacterized lipoprotein YehR (DUF1307 family)